MPSAEASADGPFAGDAVVILAAGSGRRLGLGPKAHVELGGESFLARIVGACRGAGLRRVYAVGSASDPAIAPACARLGVTLVVNVDPARGMSSSVHAGLEAITRVRPAATIVFPVDLPLVRAGTLRLLADAAIANPDAWARPCLGDASGHPIALGASLVGRVLDRGPSVPLRDALRAIDAPCVDAPCDDPGVLTDIDELADLAAARA